MKPKIRIGGRQQGKTTYVTEWAREQKERDKSKRVAVVVASQERKRRLKSDLSLDNIRIINGSRPEKLRAMDFDVVGVDNLWHFHNPKKIINALLGPETDIMCTLNDIFDIDKIWSGELKDN